MKWNEKKFVSDQSTSTVGFHSILMVQLCTAREPHNERQRKNKNFNIVASSNKCCTGTLHTILVTFIIIIFGYEQKKCVRNCHSHRPCFDSISKMKMMWGMWRNWRQRQVMSRELNWIEGGEFEHPTTSACFHSYLVYNTISIEPQRKENESWTHCQP